MSATALLLIKMFSLVGCVMLFADPWGTPPPYSLWFVPFVSAAFIGLSAAIDVERQRRGENTHWRIGNVVLATRVSIVLFLLGGVFPGVVKSIAEKGISNLMVNHFFWLTLTALAILAFGPIRQKTVRHTD